MRVLVNIAHGLDPSVPAGAAETFRPEAAVHMIAFDTSKAQRIFGIDMISKEVCVRDMLACFKEKGWWPKQN